MWAGQTDGRLRLCWPQECRQQHLNGPLQLGHTQPKQLRPHQHKTLCKLIADAESSGLRPGTEPLAGGSRRVTTSVSYAGEKTANWKPNLMEQHAMTCHPERWSEHPYELNSTLTLMPETCTTGEPQIHKSSQLTPLYPASLTPKGTHSGEMLYPDNILLGTASWRTACGKTGLEELHASPGMSPAALRTPTNFNEGGRVQSNRQRCTQGTARNLKALQARIREAHTPSGDSSRLFECLEEEHAPTQNKPPSRVQSLCANS